MATVVQTFGAGAIQGTGSAIATALTGNGDTYLAIKWDDLKGFLTNGATATPDSGDDWLAGLTYYWRNYTNNSQNTERLFTVVDGGKSFDQGFYRPNVDLIAFTSTVNVYNPDSTPASPDPGNL